MSPRRPRRHARLEHALSPQGVARIAVVSDTHDRPHPALLGHLEALGPSLVLHAGDIGGEGVISQLEALCPVAAVRGNVDGRRHPDTLHLVLTRGGDPALAVLLVHVGQYRTHLRGEVRELAARLEVGLVVCGHSHVPFIGRDRGGVAVLNPGAAGPRRFTLPITFAVIEVDHAGVALRHVDCETGAPWVP